MGKPALEINHHQMTIDCYNQDAPYWGTRFLSLDTRELCQRFLSHLPEKAHILDIGCGPGRDTKYFLDEGYQVTAFDAAEELVKLARQHTGQPILHMTFEEMTFREEFDGIWSMASLLHISHQDIITIFKNNLIPALKNHREFYISACSMVKAKESLKIVILLIILKKVCNLFLNSSKSSSPSTFG